MPGWHLLLRASLPGGGAADWCSAGMTDSTNSPPQGLRRCGKSVTARSQLRGGDAKVNAGVVRDVLSGTEGVARDAVLVNAAAGLVAFDTTAEGPFLDRMQKAYARAAESIDSGAATAVLEKWVSLTRS